MALKDISSKHAAIDKANAQMVAIVAVAAFLTVFSLIAGKAALSTNRYQARVSDAKETANIQLKDNLKAYEQLVSSYKAFDENPKNIIGGNASGTADNDGTNSKIVLDALPSDYDFPALTSSLEKLLIDNGYKIGGINGVDDQLAQQATEASASPQVVNIPFTLNITGADYNSVQKLLTLLDKTIRPIQIDSFDITGNNNDLTVTISAHTFYQSEKAISITKQVIK